MKRLTAKWGVLDRLQVMRPRPLKRKGRLRVQGCNLLHGHDKQFNALSGKEALGKIQRFTAGEPQGETPD